MQAVAFPISGRHMSNSGQTNSMQLMARRTPTLMGMSSKQRCLKPWMDGLLRAFLMSADFRGVF